MATRITGQKDEIAKTLRDLQSNEGRLRHNAYVCEGAELVRRAFDYAGGVTSVVLAERFAATDDGHALLVAAVQRNIRAYVSTEGLLGKLFDAKPTPECAAIVERRVLPIDQMLDGSASFLCMIEDCENADNLGMLLRSADAAGLQGILASQKTVDPFNRRTVRGSRGGVFTVPICVGVDPLAAILQAKEAGYSVVGTSANTESNYTAPDYTRPTVIIVGNEHVGMSEETQAACDRVVRIPMLGKINSLNIAVAASVMFYEVVRQRSNAQDRND